MKRCFTCNRFWSTGAERIAGEARQTRAHGNVVHNTALSVDPTHSRARVTTVADQTGEVGRTVSTDDTLWATSTCVGVAYIGRDTGAVRGDSVWAGALGVLPTGRGRAGVCGRW